MMVVDRMIEVVTIWFEGKSFFIKQIAFSISNEQLESTRATLEAMKNKSSMVEAK